MSSVKDSNLNTLTVVGSVPPNSAGLASAMAAANTFTGKAGLVDPLRYRFLVSFEELLTNVIVHGNAAHDTTIDFELAWDAGAVRISITDAGAAFDPTSIPLPSDDDPEDPEREGGWGWRLILSWCDLGQYTRVDGRNCISLTVRAEHG